MLRTFLAFKPKKLRNLKASSSFYVLIKKKTCTKSVKKSTKKSPLMKACIVFIGLF